MEKVANYLFFYGTLQNTPRNPFQKTIHKFCAFFAPGYTFGNLFYAGNYPGLVTSSDTTQKVFGEIYSTINADALLPIIDKYEGCSPSDPLPHEYRRIKCQVFTQAHQAIDAWVYNYEFDTNQLEYIAHGNYLEFLKTTIKSAPGQ